MSTFMCFSIILCLLASIFALTVGTDIDHVLTTVPVSFLLGTTEAGDTTALTTIPTGYGGTSADLSMGLSLVESTAV